MFSLHYDHTLQLRYYQHILLLYLQVLMLSVFGKGCLLCVKKKTQSSCSMLLFWEMSLPLQSIFTSIPMKYESLSFCHIQYKLTSTNFNWTQHKKGALGYSVELTSYPVSQLLFLACRKKLFRFSQQKRRTAGCEDTVEL